ncbi:MAG: hypothetical protein AB7L66_07810 [Gemmatimonadales bacterium]
MTAPRLALAGALLLSCSCAGRPGAGSTSATRDSAGVEIVENPNGTWETGKAWTIAAEPSLDIGGGERPEIDLVQVTGAVRLGDGRIAVATLNEIRFFDASGNHLLSAGRKGSGPGEFQAVGGLWRSAGDSLLASDMMLQRLSVLAPNGDYHRSFNLGAQAQLAPGPGGQFGMAIPVGLLGDGSIIGMRLGFTIGAKHEGSYRDSVALIRYGTDGSVTDTLGRFPGIEMVDAVLSFGGQSMPTPGPVPLGKVTATGVGAETFYVATNAQWEIEARNPDGTLRRIIRVAAPAARVAESEVAAHKQEQKDVLEGTPQFRSIPQQFKDQFLARIDNATYPETKPWIAGIFPVSDGTLWVEEFGTAGNPSRRYAILGADGRFLGRLDGPPKFRMTAAYPDGIIGVWKDENDVEHVRFYPVARS